MRGSARLLSGLAAAAFAFLIVGLVTWSVERAQIKAVHRHYAARAHLVFSAVGIDQIAAPGEAHRANVWQGIDLVGIDIREAPQVV